MKVMYFIHSLAIGGAETICTKYLLSLKKNNVEVVLVVINRVGTFLEEELNRNNVKIISISPLISRGAISTKLNGIYRRIVPFRLLWNKIIEYEKPDVIHVNTASFQYFVPSNFSPNKVIYTFHGHVERYLQMMKKDGRINMQIFANAGMRFFALSSEIASEIKKTLHTENVVYMPNALDLNEIRKNRYIKSDFTAKLGISGDSFLIGHVARFCEEKNQERTLRIFQELLKLQKNAYLLFVGNDNNEHGRKVKKLVSDLNLDSRVFFLGIREDSTKIISALDVMVLPSITESFSLVMLEAQAHNIRAVASLSVPESVICNDNCFRLSLDESDYKWAYYLASNFSEKHNYNLDNFAIDNVIDKMLNEYKNIAHSSEDTLNENM